MSRSLQPPAAGEHLVGLRYKHPFREERPDPSRVNQTRIPVSATAIVDADYVTLEDGSGLVHTAPGHGAEDYQTGLRVGLPVYCPVHGERDCYDESVPEWLARHVDLEGERPCRQAAHRVRAHVLLAHRFMHSYPHDWRSKTPVIFRCTEQWFVDVNKPTKRDEDKGLREMALAATRRGRLASTSSPRGDSNRMRGMLDYSSGLVHLASACVGAADPGVHHARRQRIHDGDVIESRRGPCAHKGVRRVVQRITRSTARPVRSERRP